MAYVGGELSVSTKLGRRAPETICLTCGLCCNGVIFSDVKLLPKDDATSLASLGLSLFPSRSKRTDASASPKPIWRFPQPCAALRGCRCRIYGSRPAYCQDFECLLLKKVQGHKLTRSEALRLIRTARNRAQTVRNLLRALGDSEEAIALADRFRRITQRLVRSTTDERTAELYSRLTLAFHKLNVLIHREFYRES